MCNTNQLPADITDTSPEVSTVADIGVADPVTSVDSKSTPAVLSTALFSTLKVMVVLADTVPPFTWIAFCSNLQNGPGITPDVTELTTQV
jgi:hypothetical protein